MNLDCGAIMDGEALVPYLLNLVVKTTSGLKTLSEELGFGQEEFVPWQLGAVM